MAPFKLFLLLVLLVGSFGLECPSDRIFLSVFKQNSPVAFNQRDESFAIKGYLLTNYETFVTENPLVTFKANYTYEYCLPRTKNLVYDLFLFDSKGNGWDDGSYIEIKSETGVLLFKGQCIQGKLQRYRIRLTYIISPYQVWGVLESESLDSLWNQLLETDYVLATFDEDYLKEDENADSYEHKILGDPSSHNYYVNRFYLQYGEYYAGLELGITNDFESVSIYINHILVYSEKNHQDNHKNYYKILISGTALHDGYNLIMFEFDKGDHANNVYIYGYPAYEPSQCVYIPYSQVVDHSPVVSGHDVNTAFDYSTNYFYFDQAKNAYLTFNNVYFDVTVINKYAVYDYVFAYAPRNWTLAGSNDLHQWNEIDREDQPSVDHILQKYDYYMNQQNKGYKYYRYTILDNKGAQVVWLPELFPYVCHMGFASNFYEPSSYNMAYNVQREIRPFMGDKNFGDEELTFSVHPPFPYSMSLDTHTGVIKGSFGYENPERVFYTITVKGDKHVQQQTLFFSLSEAYSFDYVNVNGKAQYFNRYVETPIFVLFIVIAVAVCVLLFLLMEVIQFMRL